MVRWSRRGSWIALGVAVFCALTLLYLIVSTAVDKNTSMWAKALLLGIGVAAAGSALLVADHEALHDGPRALLRPRAIAGLLVAMFAAFGTLTDALSLFEPRPVVESRPGVIEAAVTRIEQRTAPAPVRASRVRRRIGGLWGEPGCAVAYRFAVRDAALVVDAARRPAGMPPFRLVATITAADADTMTVTGEAPAAARGRAAVFAYSTNGVTERLRWDDKSGATPLDLDRCG